MPRNKLSDTYKENVPPKALHPYPEVTKISLLDIPSGTSPPPAHEAGNSHRNTADPQLDSLDNWFPIQSDDDRKDSDIEIEGPWEEDEVEIWQNTGGDFDVMMDYSPDDSSPSNLSGRYPHTIPHIPFNSLATPAKLTTERTIRPQPVILLERLPAPQLMLYQEIDPRTIDKLAKRSRHLNAATKVSNVVGKKRRRRQLQRSRIDITLSDSGDEASDEADASSDSTEEPNHKQLGRRPNKRQKLMAHPLKIRKSYKPSKEGGVNGRRKLTTQIDWSDDWWETQNIPADLAETIKLCKETKCTRSHTDPCPVLLHISHFGARWSHALKCFYCIDHSRLVPGDGFRSHFGGRLHPKAIPGTTRYIFLTASAFHLADCYPEMRNQSYEKLKLSLPAQLPERLPLKEDSDSFQKRYKCPSTTCEAWVAVNKGKGAPISELRRHVKTHDKILENDFPPVSPQWTQLVGVGQGYHSNGSTHYFTFPETYRPSTSNAHKPVFSTVDLAAPSTDTWPVLLGWENYINQITLKLGSREKVVDKLRDLVSLPSRRRISTCTGLMNILERGLFISNNLNLSYLEDAATWVSLMHKSFRAHFGHGGKKPFQPFVNKTQYYKYRQPLIFVEALVIRSIHDKIWNHPDAIPVEHSDETCQAGLALYKYFLSSYAHPDLEELMIRKHDLFVAILRAGEKSEKKVACPLGQALLACSLMPNGQWRKGSLVRSSVITAKWSLSAIDAHWCRLATTGDERYVPFSSAESHLTTPDISEVHPPNDPSPADAHILLYDETDEESGEEDEIEIGGDEPSHDFDFGVIDVVELEETLQRISRVLDTPNSESQKARPFNSVTIKQVLKSRLKYISPAGETTFITAFQRVLSVSSALFNPAQHKPPFTTTLQNGSFILTNRVDAPVSLALQKFREAACLSTNNLKSCVEAALPSGVSIYDIPVNRLTDDFSSAAIHKQPQNALLLQPLVSKYWRVLLAGPSGGKALFDSDGVVRVEVDHWLQKYDACYASAAAAMILNSGALDHFSFKHYCYDGPRRNIFLLRNGQLSFVNPISSHRVTDSHLALVTMPADMTRLLLVLINILLPIAIKLRALKGQHLPFQSTHIWVLPRRHTTGDIKWRYSSVDVNKQLIDLTTRLFGVTLNGEIIRKMVNQVFSSEFPLLLSNSMHLRSPVDDLAQHLWITGLHNYGKLGHFPSHSALVGDRPARHLVYCEIWHALTNTGPIYEGWRPMVQGTTLFPERIFPEDAFYTARRLVLLYYRIRDASRPVDRATLVKKLLSAKPFLQGITPMDKAEIIGDRPLHVVIRILILGLGQINGQIPAITEKHVADSVVLLMRALCEWATGDFIDLSDPSCESAMHFEIVRSRLLTKLVENKFHEKESWQGLRVLIGHDLPMF